MSTVRMVLPLEIPKIEYYRYIPETRRLIFSPIKKNNLRHAQKQLLEKMEIRHSP